jgi:hypothetical protein
MHGKERIAEVLAVRLAADSPSSGGFAADLRVHRQALEQPRRRLFSSEPLYRLPIQATVKGLGPEKSV